MSRSPESPRRTPSALHVRPAAGTRPGAPGAGEPMTIGVVLLIVLCNMSSFRASKVLISLFALELGASQFYIGIMIAMYSLLPALLAVHAGKVSDRLGVRLPMLVGSLGIVAGLAGAGALAERAGAVRVGGADRREPHVLQPVRAEPRRLAGRPGRAHQEFQQLRARDVGRLLHRAARRRASPSTTSGTRRAISALPRCRSCRSRSCSARATSASGRARRPRRRRRSSSTQPARATRCCAAR